MQELGALQIQYHHASDPALRFVALLRAALAGGRAHVADRQGSPPESPELWGWRRKPAGRGWVPQGTRVGWIARSDLFLEPASSYHVVQQLAGAEHLAVSEQTLRYRLRERGLLVTHEDYERFVTCAGGHFHDEFDLKAVNEILLRMRWPRRHRR